eukprot:TRINITY_DN19039_c0_g1_i1.p1 TRINITY_DN19039_c0_g1~~TRINITY_DN19039_c0_g1_i1.p1  ORF type:complete len:391 (+),score=101.49 TRINITY_DN19039_c0_g1_i1:50-1174(+)
MAPPRRSAPRGACRSLAAVVLASLPACRGQQCLGTETVPADAWREAEQAAAGTDRAQFTSSASWLAWSRAWLPLGQRAWMQLERNLVDCPEGTVSAISHSLAALDEQHGDARSLDAIKMLYHLFAADAPLAAVRQSESLWQQSWLMTAASLVRFMYLKWVHVPQDEVSSSDVTAGDERLQRHHAFLFRHSVDAFASSGVYDLDLTENSVLFSEAFAFASFCQLHDVDLVVESGVYKGSSTEIWSLIAKDVLAMDIFLAPEAKARLGRRSNVRLLEGDGRELLPELLAQQRHRRVAVFIDGPKGELAIRLGLELRKLPQVAFVAMHDMAPYRQQLRSHGAFFFSDETWFQEAYGHLDAPFRMRPDIVAGGTMAFF